MLSSVDGSPGAIIRVPPYPYPPAPKYKSASPPPRWAYLPEIHPCCPRADYCLICVDKRPLIGGVDDFT